MSRRLIIGYNGGGNSEDALALGGALATALAGEPLVASIVPCLDHLIPPTEQQQMRRTEAERIGDAARAGLGGLEVEVRVLADDSPARALDRLIESEQPLGLVIGSGHRGGIGRVFLGDVGTSLLSGAACAVAVAPGGYAERAHGRLLRIAVAVNESEESWAALRTAVALAERLNASLMVLTVARPLRYGYAVPFSVVDTGLLADATRERSERMLDRALERVPARMPLQRRLVTGDPAASIAAATGDHDLLIVGARGYGPLRRALLGSVSARLARTAGCPLLVLPREGADDLRRRGELQAVAGSTPLV
jgi:nucleotide-binding universal stress UspA family protein